MKELIKNILLSDYGIRAIISFAGFSTGYYSVMSFFGQIIKLEKKEYAKRKTKLLASIISVLASLLTTFLISYKFYPIKDTKSFIITTITWWIIGGAVFLGLKNVDKLIRIIKGIKIKK